MPAATAAVRVRVERRGRIFVIINLLLERERDTVQRERSKNYSKIPHLLFG